MRFFILISILYFNLAEACHLHKLDFYIEAKKIYKTSSFKISEFNKDENQKWNLNLTFNKKDQKRIKIFTKDNIGKNMNIALDNTPIASSQIVSELDTSKGLSISTNLNDEKIEDLKKDCKHH